MNTIDPQRTYSITEAAEIAGRSVEYIRLKIKSKKLVAARIDRGPWRIAGASLAKMMAPITAIQPATVPPDREWAERCRKALLSF